MRAQGTAFAVGAAILALSGCGSSAEPQAVRGCGKAVLADWTDGTIDKIYAGPCYLAAIDRLPEDVRAYTTAKDDITRALYARRADS